MSIPRFDELLNPLLEALRNLGCSESNAAVVDKSERITDLSDGVQGEDHSPKLLQSRYSLDTPPKKR